MPIPKDRQGDWHDALELKLRRTRGEAFEDFFATMMEFRHEDGFERVAASGRAGDRKCDGFLHATAEVFQCYGAENGGAKKAAVNATLTRKMDDDYRGASRHWARMSGWHMVHNFVDGVGAEPLAKMEELRAANPHHRLHFFGRTSFKKVIFDLEEDQVAALVGRAASLADFENLQPPEIVAVIGAVMRGTSDDLPEDERQAPVPRDKLRYNNLTGAVARKVAMGRSNADIVEAHVRNDPNPLLGITIANEFRRRYKDLALQDLTPNEVMVGLYDGIVGTGNPTQERDVAAWSLLAHLFAACSIFEDRPAGEAP